MDKRKQLRQDIAHLLKHRLAYCVTRPDGQIGYACSEYGRQLLAEINKRNKAKENRS